MAEKCWCGRALIAISECLETSRWECPVHGSDWQRDPNLAALEKAMFMAHHRYRFDLGISLPKHEQERRFPGTTIAEAETDSDPLSTMWERMPWQEREAFAYYAKAALRFVGSVDAKGEVVVLGRDAISKAREALHDAMVCLEFHFHMVREGSVQTIPAGIVKETSVLIVHDECRDALRSLRGEGGER